jgi:hypothetical protein
MFLSALALVFGTMGSAQATPALFSDLMNPGFIGWFETKPYDHIISDTVPDGAFITNASLALTFKDDKQGLDELLGGEKVYVNYDGQEWLNSVSNQKYDISVDASSLTDGILAVSVTSLWGDVYLKESLLTGWWEFETGNHDGDNGGAPVPEPATMLLLGSGLAGLAGLRKKFKK